MNSWDADLAKDADCPRDCFASIAALLPWKGAVRLQHSRHGAVIKHGVIRPIDEIRVQVFCSFPMNLSE